MMTKSYPAAATREVANGSVKPMKIPSWGPVEVREEMKGAIVDEGVRMVSPAIHSHACSEYACEFLGIFLFFSFRL